MIGGEPRFSAIAAVCVDATVRVYITGYLGQRIVWYEIFVEAKVGSRDRDWDRDREWGDWGS